MTRQEEYAHKRQVVLGFMQQHRLEALVLTRRCNFAWYTAGGSNHVGTGAELGAASVLITAEADLCITSNIESPRVAAEELGELGIAVRAANWYDATDAGRAWSGAIGRRRAACDAKVPGLPDGVTSVPAAFNALRWTLTPAEIDRYRCLAREVAAGLEGACRSARQGMSEYELAGAILAALQPAGIRVPVLLIAADDRVQRFRHPIPTEKRFSRYGMAVTGAERGGLNVSATRLFAFGPLSDDLRRRHQAVCQVDAALIAASRPGKTLGSALAAARKAYADAGFADEWQHHHQGGSTGYLGREVKATPGNSTVIAAHQAFAWNPSIAGTKSEDTVLVGPDGNEILSRSGEWPTTDYRAGATCYPRCDILVL